MIGELTQFAEGAATVEMAGKSKRPVATLPVIVGLPRPEIAISATSARELPFDTANNRSGQFACDLHRWGSSRPILLKNSLSVQR
jgi:hypothetical protein